MNLELLIISADDVGTRMMMAGLDEALVPYTEVRLDQPDRPIIDEGFLVDASEPGIRRARFQAVVLPNNAPHGLTREERAALTRVEREFRLRQLDAYVYPSPAVGLHYPADHDFAGSLDGITAQLTDAARAQGFSYLKGSVPFEDLDPAVCEIYGYLSRPIDGAKFTSFLETPLARNGGAPAVLLGVLEENGREEMILTAAMNQYQLAQQALFPGLLSWLTYGVHLGLERHFLSVHIDDVFLSDSRWLEEHNCTFGSLNCDPESPPSDILMTPDDLDFLIAWQQRQGLKLDMVFNGEGYDQATTPTAVALGNALLARKDALRWLSHTYSHAYLGCVQDESVLPWRCVTGPDGDVAWTSRDTLYQELERNIDFAYRHGITIDESELVTGEHSGLRRTPVEPGDNPHLAGVLAELGISWVGSDSSREIDQRALGASSTVPRYPLNIFYNVANESEEVDLYNWIYTPLAHGGSGLCEIDPKSSCIAPLDRASGFANYVVPQQARMVLMHALSNSPRPHYAHQSNLAEGRILYPVLDMMLSVYRGLFAETLPIINATLAEFGAENQRRAAWARDRRQVTAYVEDGELVLQAAGPVQVPVTAPSTDLDEALPYADLMTAWEPTNVTKVTYGLTDAVRYPR